MALPSVSLNEIILGSIYSSKYELWLQKKLEKALEAYRVQIIVETDPESPIESCKAESLSLRLNARIINLSGKSDSELCDALKNWASHNGFQMAATTGYLIKATVILPDAVSINVVPYEKPETPEELKADSPEDISPSPQLPAEQQEPNDTALETQEPVAQEPVVVEEEKSKEEDKKETK